MSEVPSSESLMGLRKCLVEGIPVEDAGDNLKLNGVLYLKSQLTPFKSSEDGYFSVGSLARFMEFTVAGKTDIPKYMKAARSEQKVKFKDRKDVVEFLTGISEWCDKIEADRVEKGEKESKKLAQPAPLASKQSESEISPVQQLIKRIKKRESSHYDRNTVLLSSHRFGDALKLDRETKKQKTIQVQKEMLKAVGVKVSSGSAAGGPIIIVPATFTAPLNLYNVKNFLENGIFEHSDAVRERDPVKPEFVSVEKAIGEHGVVRFKVVDSIKRFRTEDWERVVAVFTMGPTWQFKDWKIWKSDPALIFANCQGLHLYFDDAKLAPHLMTWNVLLCPLKKQTRSQDGIEQHRVWSAIQKFAQTKKLDILKAGVISKR